jgi:hypothetical protein
MDPTAQAAIASLHTLEQADAHFLHVARLCAQSIALYYATVVHDGVPKPLAAILVREYQAQQQHYAHLAGGSR